MLNLGPIRIFDSRKARLRYEEYKQYRSSDFVVPPGYIGLVEIIAPEDYLPKMTFTAVKFPTAQHGEDSDCFDECGIGKRYRRWKCTQSLGDHRSPNILPTKYTEYNEHIVYWGLDPFLDKIVEFEYVVRPGNYYIIADRCENDVLDDCVNPTIIEFSLERRYPSFHDLDLVHECGVWRQRQLQVPLSYTPPTPPPPTPPPPETVNVTVNWRLDWGETNPTSSIYRTENYTVNKGDFVSLEAGSAPARCTDSSHTFYRGLFQGTTVVTTEASYTTAVNEDVEYTFVFHCWEVIQPETVNVTVNWRLDWGETNPTSSIYKTESHTLVKGESLPLQAGNAPARCTDSSHTFYRGLFQGTTVVTTDANYNAVVNEDAEYTFVFHCWEVIQPNTVKLNVHWYFTRDDISNFNLAQCNDFSDNPTIFTPQCAAENFRLLTNDYLGFTNDPIDDPIAAQLYYAVEEYQLILQKGVSHGIVEELSETLQSALNNSKIITTGIWNSTFGLYHLSPGAALRDIVDYQIVCSEDIHIWIAVVSLDFSTFDSIGTLVNWKSKYLPSRN